MTLVPRVMEMTADCWLVTCADDDGNMPAGACVMGTMVDGTCDVPEGRATVALLVKTPRTGNVTSMFVCRVKRMVTTFVNCSIDRLVGCTRVFVNPPVIEFVKPNRFVNGKTALLVSGIAKTGT